MTHPRLLPDLTHGQVRDRTGGETSGSYGSVLADIITRVEGLLGAVFAHRGLDPKAAPLYAQALTGMVSMTGQWWLDNPQLSKQEVATHLVNLAWNGMHNLGKEFHLSDEAGHLADPGSRLQ